MSGIQYTKEEQLEIYLKLSKHKIETLQSKLDKAVEALEFYKRESERYPSGWVCRGGVAIDALKQIKELRDGE